MSFIHDVQGEKMIEIVLVALGGGLGFAAGYFYAKSKSTENQSVVPEMDLSSQNNALNNMSVQLAEMKAKFEEMEKSRTRLDEARRKTDEERERRFQDFISNINKLFGEMKENAEKIDSEKEKRIKELMEQNKKFFEEQKKRTEEFLIQQGKSRGEIEKQRDAQIEDMKRMVERFTKTLSGTQSRGKAGEIILKDVLKSSIRAGVVETNLRTDNGVVEFAWNLQDGKYIPIDSKLPDIFELVEKYEKAKGNEDSQGLIRKDIIKKVKKQIKTVEKYQNLSNTIDSCILVVPEATLQLAPELVGEGREHNVFVCSYRDVFPVAHVLQDQYIRSKREGDVGKYRMIVKSMLQIVDKMEEKSHTIDRAITTLTNANNEIKESLVKSRITGKSADAIGDSVSEVVDDSEWE